MSIIILLVAAVLDYLIGDPWHWLHPVQVMGWTISQWTKFTLKYCDRPVLQRCSGVGMGLTVIIGSGVLGWLIVRGASLVHPLFGIVTHSIMLASCFATRSLRNSAQDVLQALNCGNLEQARTKLSLFVGRDTQNLSEAEILRAVMETVTENATDGAISPLFYAIIGAFIPTVGSVPLALAYKAASTLDSMVGYRSAPYTYIGWFSARLEDYLTWLPCRLNVFTLALLSGKPIKVWNICRRDAVKDPSPNSGWSECAYAVVLGVQVGGINWYGGVAKSKPLLGDAIYPITVVRVEQALALTRYCFLIWLVIALILLLAISTITS
ncbi:cobalamin biosynthesis protein CobD [Aliterella atlantica CENA595]|uniref:Cobalamin biosynthesis protein CobD n=1 Tax=Aliterella atlantica CENA595 TaxID=1618023 RepID=A0A0D8ZRS0_9CYAN|nr:cobalamin biosynthesis protein CobD [Aliterella atlantica CENA595]